MKLLREPADSTQKGEPQVPMPRREIKKEKWCSHHRVCHPLGDFGVDRSRSTGYSSSCKVAQSDRRKARERNGSSTSLDDMRRIWAKLSNGGCITWGGAVNSKGYGVVGGYGQNKLVHRVIYEWFTQGPLPKALQIHHRCGVKLCVNPSHLQALTPAEHERITSRRRRARCRPVSARTGVRSSRPVVQRASDSSRQG